MGLLGSKDRPVEREELPRFEYDVSVNSNGMPVTSLGKAMTSHSRVGGWRVHAVYALNGETVVVYERPATD